MLRFGLSARGPGGLSPLGGRTVTFPVWRFTSLAPHLDIFVIQHLFKPIVAFVQASVQRHLFEPWGICSSRHIISRSPVICRAAVFMSQVSGLRSSARTVNIYPCFLTAFFVFILLLTKRPPMLWGSTCRVVTSFRPDNAYICQPNAYVYQPTDWTIDRLTPTDTRVERVYPSTTRQSIDQTTVRLHRTLAPYCYDFDYCRADTPTVILFDWY